MSESKSIIALLIACIAFVGMAAALKTVGNRQYQPIDLSSRASSQIDAGPLTVDRSFFTQEPASQAQPVKTKQTVVADETGTSVPKSTPAPVSAPVPAPASAPAPKPVVAPDAVSADAYVVGDIDTGKIYLKKNASTILPFASMSKLITAIVSTDMYKPTDEITITGAETTGLPQELSGLTAGERFSAQELLYPMLMSSSNIAAEALASSGDRAKFLDLMYGYSWEIGMPGSFFADPTGLSERNSGTAIGFFAMAQYLYSHRPDILAITRIPHLSMATTTEHNAHEFQNIHPFAVDPRFLGGKTGHTDAALDTMLTIMKISGHPIAVIVLHSINARERDTNILLDRVSALIAAGK